MAFGDVFDIKISFSVLPPCYIRKIPRMTPWAPKDEALRVPLIHSELFSEEDGVISLFFVEIALDVARAAIAIDWARHVVSRNTGQIDLTAELILGAITTDEMKGIRLTQTTDSFVCFWARANHWNAALSPSDELRLAHALSRRKPKRFKSPAMRGARDALAADGCLSVNAQSPKCVCHP